MTALDELLWPIERAEEAVRLTARAAGFRTGDGRAPASDGTIESLSLVASALDLDGEAVECSYRELDRVLRGIGPALLGVTVGSETRLLALLPSAFGARVLAPSGRVHRVAIAEVRALAARGVEESPGAKRVAGLLRASADRDTVRRIAAELGGRSAIGPFLVLRAHPNAPFRELVREQRLSARAIALVAVHAAQSAAFVVSWWLLGRGAFSGELDASWIAAWALALASSVLLRTFGSFVEARLAVAAGRAIKQRIFEGALALAPDEMRKDGAGEKLGRVLESTEVELAGVTGSLGAGLALIELVFAGAAMALGAGGTLAVALFAGYLALTLAALAALYRRQRRWTDERLSITNDLVERMVGHRTRVAQELPSEHHAGEDRALERYLDRSRALDRAAVWVASLPRGWALVGVLGLVPAFLAGAPPAALAVAIGGVLLGLSALGALSNALAQLAGALIAAQRIRPLFEAARRRSAPGDVESAAAAPGDGTLSLAGVAFRHRGRESRVLDGCDLVARSGDRILLEGRSGGGKSTLAAIVGGLREPSEGLVLVDGLDLPSLGSDAWRARVATVPQFHENHVLSSSFAFNALMGRSWPPSRADFEKLASVCEELGLGPLLAKMPGGLEQALGDSGWQLSHGERGRLFLARAMVSEAKVWILDESLAALDPQSYERCLAAIVRRAPTLLVVSHRARAPAPAR